MNQQQTVWQVWHDRDSSARSALRATHAMRQAWLHLDRDRHFGPRKSPAPSKGFYIGRADVKATRQIDLYPGIETFKLDTKTQVMPLSKFLSEVGG